jgi:hypothetical protein
MLDPLIVYIHADRMIVLALGRNRSLIMRTFKEQAAAARASGLKRFIADRPCRHGHLERRADRQGTCIACSYLRYRPVARSLVNATNSASE